MDFTTYLPEKLKEQYDQTGSAGTVLEKVLELFSQVLSGDTSSTNDLQAKLNELQYFWNSYEVEDLVKLKRVLDPQNIIDKIVSINEICSITTTENSERAFLMTIPLFNKMKGTLVGLTNVLKLFGITITIIPWYDPDYPRPDDPECSVMISTFLEEGCLDAGTTSLIEEIVKSLLDICTIISVFEMIKAFSIQIPIDETLYTIEKYKYLCTVHDWRDSRPCCDTYGIANISQTPFYTDPDPIAIKCDGSFTYNGAWVHKCLECLDCSLDRVDLAIVDPIARCYSEVNVSSIEFQSGHTVRYYLESSVGLSTVGVGDAVHIADAHYDINNGELIISALNNINHWVEVTNNLRSSSSRDEADSIGCNALMAISLYTGQNRDILDYEHPMRIPVYDNPILMGIDLGESIGDGTGYTSNEFVGSNWLKAGDYRKCPDTFEGFYSILNGDRQWVLYESDSIGSEYYLNLEDSLGADILSEPGVVLEDGTALTRGTHTLLGVGEWDYTYDVTIGYNTVFIKLSDGSDPNLQSDHYLEAGVVKDYCIDTIETHGPDHHYFVPT
jgi:hypothetical protein